MPAALQILLCVALISASTYLFAHLGIRSIWNALWLAGFPIGIAQIANRDAGTRALMSLALLLCSVAATTLTAVIFGLMD